MKIAFSTWKNRISPVFDVSGEIILVDYDFGKISSQQRLRLPKGQDRCLWLAGKDVEVLVCGAISSQLKTRLEWMKIRVFPFIAGETDQVIHAWSETKVNIDKFMMPGCCSLMAQKQAKTKEGLDMRAKNQGQACPRGKAQGKGQGRVQGGAASAGVKAGTSSGTCTCPGCGHQTPHEKGVPCMNIKCPKCGAAMRGRP